MSTVRTAAFLATQAARADARRRTSGKVKCKPPNRRCGDRCIPPEWDCRLRGEGGDAHLKAVGNGSDPLAALSNVQRGGQRLIKGITKGNFSELEGGRRAIIRGAVKASPQDLKDKKELQGKLVQATIGVGAALAIVGGGIRVHGILMNTRAYRNGPGRQVEDAVNDAMQDVLDRNPLTGPERAIRRGTAAGVAEGVASRMQRDYNFGPVGMNAQLGVASKRMRRTPVQFDSPNATVERSVLGVKPRSFAPENDISGLPRWHTESMKKFWTAPRTRDQMAVADIGEGSFFSVATGESYLRKQFSVEDTTTKGGGLITAISRKLQRDHESLLEYAKDRGLNISQITERQRLADSLLSGKAVPDGTRITVRNQLADMADPAFNARDTAKNVYRQTISGFDRFYANTADSFESYYKADGGIKALTVENHDIVKNAVQGHAQFLSQRLYPGATAAVVRGEATADLLNRRYYQLNGDRKQAAMPWTASRPLVLKAASEYAGKPVTNINDAVRTLTADGGFLGLQVQQPLVAPIAGPRRSATREPFKFKSVDERQSFLDIVQQFMQRKGPDGNPVFKSQAAAERAARAEIQRRRMRKDAAPPEAVRADKRCGRSGIPDNRKCSKQTMAKAAAPAKSVGRKPVKANEEGVSNRVKAAVAVGAVVGAAAGGRALYKNRQSIALYRNSADTIASGIKTLSNDKVRKSIAKLPKEWQEPANKLLGKAKLGLAYVSADAQGMKLKRIDNKNNFSTFQHPETGHTLSVGSVDDTLITFVSERKGVVPGGFPKYGMAFQTDLSFSQKQGVPKPASMKISSSVKAMFNSQLDDLPENAILFNKPFADDGLGAKRMAIYRRAGFKPLKGLRGNEMWALKNNGKLTKIPPEQEDYIADLIKGNSPKRN